MEITVIITNQPHAINYSTKLKKGNKTFGTQGWWMKKLFGSVEIPLEGAIEEYNVFHTFPAVYKSKEEVKELINGLVHRR